MALVAITGPSTPIKVSDNHTLLTNTYQLASNNLSTSQRKALLVWFLVNLVKGGSGTDYTAALGTLESDTKSFFAGFAPTRNMGNDYDAAFAAIIYQMALQAAPSPAMNTSIKDLLSDTSTLAARSGDDLDLMALFLFLKAALIF